MHEHLVAIILRVFSAMNAAPDRGIAEDLARAVEAAHVFDRELLASTIAVYAVDESGVRMHPEASSHDAKGGQSCGLLQEPCAFTRLHPTAAEQARWWVWCVTHSSLASVDSDAKRAADRLALATKLLED